MMISMTHCNRHCDTEKEFRKWIVENGLRVLYMTKFSEDWISEESFNSVLLVLIYSRSSVIFFSNKMSLK